MKLLRFAAAVSAVVLASSAQAADPIVIGVSIAQSPPGSVVQGTQVKDGVEIITKMINDKGGVLGRPLKIVYEDDQGIPEKGRAAAEKLISRDKVVAVTGGHQSSVCLAEIEVAHRYKVPYVNTNCWSDDVRIKGYPEVFNPANYNTRVSSAMADTIAALKVKSVVPSPRTPTTASARPSCWATSSRRPRRRPSTSTWRWTAPARTSRPRCCRCAPTRPSWWSTSCCRRPRTSS